MNIIVNMEIGFDGLIVGVATFLIIGVFHPIVIKAEYYFGVRCWWVFLLAGLASCVFSLFVKDMVLSVLGGVLGFSCFWSIGELFEQRKRVARGWFPKNEKRKD